MGRWGCTGTEDQGCGSDCESESGLPAEQLSDELRLAPYGLGGRGGHKESQPFNLAIAITVGRPSSFLNEKFHSSLSFSNYECSGNLVITN